MKNDIKPPKVEDIAVAIVKEENKHNETVWNSYLINLKKQTIEGVLVSTQGYGELNGEKRKTSLFRHSLDVLEPMSFKKIELITEEVLVLSNEFWVSFFLDKKMYDKKYIFLAESIHDENLISIPLINKKGVLIK